ncbi:hypothetical protein [Algibacter lectus]|uniref:Uncharacterized protein n=2 Tax=Algibacter lectus TaxID=221126 RepID=A0A090VEN0_9FLAO|nr:hypothetical protein [Algibacter lectus]GAL61834.1 hypothetical protein JCM19300_580 [Algibacter lectus]
MKKILLILCFVSIKSYSQVNIGQSKSWTNIDVSNHTQSKFNQIKSLKTLFIVPVELDIDTITPIIKSVWTINDIEFISENDFKANKYSNYLVIELMDDVGFKKRIYRYSPNESAYDAKFREQMDGKTIKEYIIFNFSLFFPNQEEAIAQIFFTPNIKKREIVTNSSDRKSILEKAIIKKKQKKNKEEIGFYNFDLGYIKNYFQFLNTSLNENTNIKVEDEFIDENEIKKLKKSTLFAPEWMMKRYEPFSSTIKKIENPEKYFSKYKYDYKVIPNEELSNKILNTKEDFYYLMHTQINENKIISVINGKTGNIVYRTATGLSYNIKPKDISLLNKQMQ